LSAHLAAKGIPGTVPRYAMLPGTSLNESLSASSCGRNFRTPSDDSPYKLEGAASPMAFRPSAAVSSTMTVRWVPPEPLELAIFHGFAKCNSHTREVNFTLKFKQFSVRLQPD